MAAGLRELKVWQEAVVLGGNVVRALRHGTRRETKVVSDRVMLTALDIASHLADGYGRYTAPEQRQLYRAAKRDLLRLETQLAIARHADVISASALAELSTHVQAVGRLLSGYLVFLDRQLAEQKDEQRETGRTR